jgi:carboxypeptidase C (cathepsin A)
LIANVVFIESPVGVGFSYSDDGNYKCDDDRTAHESRAAVEKFFEMFPELKNNKFFITGESYAGVYVPTLAEAIVQGQIDGSYTGAPLTGIAVGNGCSGTEVGICGDGPQGTYYEWDYLTQTAFVDPNLKREINSACNWTAANLNEPQALSANCVSLLNKASAQINHVNLYDIYGDCVTDMCEAYAGAKTTRGKIPNRPTYSVEENGQRFQVDRIIPHGPDACIDSGTASAYLNRADVQEAIHVRNPGFCWAVCNTAKGWSYTSTRKNLPRDTYPLLVSNIQVLIYNGDWDACKSFAIFSLYYSPAIDHSPSFSLRRRPLY